MSAIQEIAPHHRISVTPNFYIKASKPAERNPFRFDIVNETDANIALLHIEFPLKRLEPTLILSKHLPITLSPRQLVIVEGSCVSSSIGTTNESIHFRFDGFDIVRWVCVETSANSPKKTSPAKPKTVQLRSLSWYPLPPALLQLLHDFRYKMGYPTLLQRLHRLYPTLQQPLSVTTYADRFHTLLYLEEIKETIEMTDYDQDSVQLVRDGEYLKLAVPHLGEKGSQLHLGCVVEVRTAAKPTEKQNGIVMKITAHHIHVKFSTEWHELYDGEKLAVHLKPSRTVSRRMHQAVDLALEKLGTELLFPTCVPKKKPQVNFTLDPNEKPTVLVKLCENQDGTGVDRASVNGEVADPIEYRERSSSNDSNDLQSNEESRPSLKAHSRVWYNSERKHKRKKAIGNHQGRTRSISSSSNSDVGTKLLVKSSKNQASTTDSTSPGVTGKESEIIESLRVLNLSGPDNFNPDSGTNLLEKSSKKQGSTTDSTSPGVTGKESEITEALRGLNLSGPNNFNPDLGTNLLEKSSKKQESTSDSRSPGVDGEVSETSDNNSQEFILAGPTNSNSDKSGDLLVKSCKTQSSTKVNRSQRVNGDRSLTFEDFQDFQGLTHKNPIAANYDKVTKLLEKWMNVGSTIIRRAAGVNGEVSGTVQDSEGLALEDSNDSNPNEVKNPSVQELQEPIPKDSNVRKRNEVTNPGTQDLQRLTPNDSNDRKPNTAPNPDTQHLQGLTPNAPDNSPTPANNSHNKLEWYNTDLNYYQKEAVRNILLGKARPLPYFIFGPPGTGKTVTLIETIQQLYNMLPHSRFVLATPSNTAADRLALKLVAAGLEDLGRFASRTYLEERDVPEGLRPFCIDADEVRAFCVSLIKTGTKNKVETRASSRIIVGTCSTVASMYNLGMPEGYFTHVIIDEAAQCVEPELLMALTFLNVADGQAILAGDPMQLGPVLVCGTITQKLGFDKSYLERLLEKFPYSPDMDKFPNSCGFNPALVTKLVYNYRSLPEIIALPNALFYNNELQSTITLEDSKEGRLLEKLQRMLPTRKGGLPAFVFYGIVCQESRCVHSPSKFNEAEAARVVHYVKRMYKLGLQCSDIGIISPYKGQIRHIKSLLSQAKLDRPKIGSVEEFQGQESNVIILSTVRSTPDYKEKSVRQLLGFLSNTKRLNVAITRAQSLLIVIGDPFVLSRDTYWRALLQYCLDRKSYYGCSYP